MKTYGIIQFEEHERETLTRALQEHGHLIEDDKGPTIRRFLHRIHQEEPFDARALEELATALTACIQRLAPETRVEWWREQGAPGADDAVQGLADTRVRQVQLLQEARDLVWEARDLVGEAPPTKAERKLVGA